MTIGYNTHVADGISIYADSLKIRASGSVFDAHYNEVNNNGTIRANQYSPVQLPLEISLPEFPIPAPGTDDYIVWGGETLTLDPGAYGKVRVRKNATLIFAGGTYHIENLSLALIGGSRVLFQGTTDLFINNRLKSGPAAVIGPADGSGISAKDIRIYVNGINGRSGSLYALPKAAQVGFNNALEANIYAPNGTIWIRPGTVARGAFIGKDVRIGISVQLNLNAAFGEPQASISASPETILLGESATLSWTSTYAGTCMIEPGIGAVDPNGSTVISPTETTTYTITASGPCGSVTDTVTVAVLYPPTVSISVDPGVILLGDSSTLTWSSTHADTCLIEPGVGTVDPNGSTTVSPIGTLTYFITATGPGGTATDTATITVLYPPTVAISAEPESIVLGDSATLTWNSTNTDTCVIEPGIGTVDPSGSITASPTETTVYTVTATGPGGSATDSVTVTVLLPPIVTINADPETILPGESSTLTWTSNNADTCTIEPDIGPVDPSGSTTVSPTESTTYTITAAGPGGSATAAVTVNANPPPLSVSISSPSDGQEFTQEPITVTGTVSGSGATVSVNGIEASVVENEFMAEDIPLIVGPNTIAAVAEDETYTVEHTITVFLKNIDLELSQLEITSLDQDPQSLKVSGEVAVTVLNNGTGDVTAPYQMILFEDIDYNRAYEEGSDNLLGGTSIASGPGAQGAMDVSMTFVGELRFRDNPVYLLVDSANDLEETDETNNLLSSRPAGADVSASLLTFDDTACPDLVSLSVRIGNSGGTALDAGVSVAFYDGDPDSGGILVGTVPTTQLLEPGHYEDLTFEWINAPSGIMSIYAQVDDDGGGTGVLDEIDEENNLVSSEIGVCATQPAPGPGGISGIVMDAVTGSFLTGADVSLHQEEGGEPGALVSQYTTGDYGWFVFSDLDTGFYILRARTDGYITEDRVFVLAAGQTLTNQNIILSPVLGPEEVRIVLTWGETPEDLEAHLTASNPEGCRHHCYYWNRDIPGANLDRDDRESYGPETITITQKTSGMYRYYVHDFTNRVSHTSQALSLSTAHVKVYSGSGAGPLGFTVPCQAGTVWHVFNLEGDTGEVTPVNRMTFQDDPGEIDFPVIGSEAARNASWGEPYTYEVEAEDPDLDILTYSLSEAPEGMAVDPITGLIQWTPSGGQGGQHHVVLDVTDGRCGDDTQAFSLNVSYVPVVAFSVEPCSGFNPGGDITLTWSTDRAETVVINQGIGEVASAGSLTIPSPESPILYTLTASNGAGEAQRAVPEMPSVTFSASPLSIPPPGGIATLTWTSRCASGCEIQGIGPVALSGSLDVTVNEATSFTLIATNGAGSVKRVLTISVSQPSYTRPEVIFISTPLCEWSPGDPVILSWHTENPSCTSSCEIDQGIGQVEPNGSLEATPTEPTTYTLTATGPAGSTVKTVQVPNLSTLRIRSLRTNPERLRPDESATLIWSTGCADTCTIDHGIGDVNTSGALTVTPADLPITYTLTAADGNGSITKSTTIYHAFPDATFSVSPGTIKLGATARFTWSTEYATSCTIEPDIGNVDLNGSLDIEPEETTVYTLTAQGLGGTTTRSVTVRYVVPTAQILANPESVVLGQSSTLSWIFSNAATCTIDQGIGEVQLGETIVVTPTEATTYTITAIGPGGTASDSVTVNLLHPPAIALFQPDGVTDTADKVFLIKWVDEDIDSNASISIYYYQDIGEGGSGGETLIVSGLDEDPDGPGSDEYAWDTTAIPEGDYYVSAVIDDGIFDPIEDHSAGVVTIVHGLLDEVKITGTDAAENDYFGHSVSISGEYAVVGAYRDDDQGTDSGSAYVLQRAGTNWIEQAKLTASDGSAHDYFGCSVSMTGDYAAVGAYNDDDGGDSSGCAYIFKRDGTSWTEQAKLTASDAAAYDYFGSCVSISGDCAIVGAYNDDDSGSAYVFERDGTDWIEQAKLTASDAAASDYFGWSVAISEDYAIVGAYGDDDGGSSSGSAYVFEREGTDWTEQAKLVCSDGHYNDYFGYSVSISGGYAIVGAYRDDDAESDSGSAYLFKREGTDWTEDEKLTASDPEESAYFGRSVAITWGGAIVGAYHKDEAGSDSGAAYIYPVMGAPVLTVSIGADPESIMAGESSTLTWASENADTCSIEPDIGVVDLTGLTTVSPPETTTYTITAIGPLGTVTDSVTVTVTYPAPSVSISANPESIQIGHTATLTWDSTYADSCVIDQGIGSVDVTGSTTVSPTDTITYTITATGPGGSATESVTVTVVYPPTVSMNADPEVIQIGDTTTLRWHSENADMCEIDQGVGTVDLSGSTTVSPTETTTYTITAAGPLSTATNSVTVTVTGLMPTVSISADPSSIQPGESSALTWTSRNADSCTIQPGIGTVAVNGSITVSPAETTTYTISVTGLGFTARNETRIFVGDGNVYSYGDPTPGEQAHLEALNRARLDPSAEAARLGIDLNEGLPPATISTTPAQPLAFNAQLHQAARLHSQDMIDQQYYGHDSLDGRTFSDRIADAGYPCPIVGESLQMRAEDTPLDEVDVLLEFHDQLFVDEGLEGRGNRLFMLRPDYKEVGLAAASGTCDGYAYCFKFTCGFGCSSHQPNAFLLGVVYDDQNGDETYTAGEGIGNVKILIVESGASTTTVSAGGYGLALPPGYYTVEASLPDGRQVTREFTMTIQNEKIDFLLSEFEIMPPTVMINANPLSLQPGESATLLWSSSHSTVATIDNGIGDVPANGSTIISPLETTTYVMTGTGPSGTVTDSVTVTVTEPFLTVSISADPASIQPGGSSMLSWTSRNAVSCAIEPGIGGVEVNGSIVVLPTETTTYTISATGLGVTAWDHVRIVVGDEDEYAYGDPSAAEQSHLEALNRARLDPTAEAARLGIDLNEGLPAGTISASPVQPLTFNAQLYQTALHHSQDMIDKGYYGHNSPDGRTPSDRIAEAGYPCPLVGENLAACMDYVPIDDVDALLAFHNRIFLDEGVEGRGHRINMLSAGYKEVGLAAAFGTCEGYPYCCRFTCDFGASSHQPNAFLLGVVYDDQNGDGIYTAGEGVGNVEILIVETGVSTTTASAGGYGLPLLPSSYTVEASLPDGRIVIRELAMTEQNVKVDFLLSEFDLVLPAVLIDANPAFIQQGDFATLTWSSSHAITATIDNGIGDVSLNGSTAVSPSDTTTYTVTASGPGGTVSDSISVYVGDYIPVPPSVNITATPTSIPQGDVSTLSWSSTNGQAAHIAPGIGHVAKSGRTIISPDHTTTYTITVTSASGSASADVKVVVTGNPDSQPEGSFGETYEKLISVDATIGEYDPRRFSVITGLVHGIDDSPVSDVFITMLGHPEYGTALTDIEGRFSIPVEGGATMTVVYEKAGLITSQRKVYVPWNDIAIAKTIQMIAEEPISTTMVFDGNADTIVTHRSSEVTDEFGSRACSMVFGGDNSAHVVDEYGNDIGELTTITTRATEFTTPESMPAILPPNSAYTHCVELSVDNAERVRFDKPVIIWIDNFLGFDVGSMVPVGYYDRDKGLWVPCENGVVVKLLDTDSDGTVDALDADGNDLPDDLDSDGSFVNEVKGLDDPDTYIPGATFWRSELSHFCPVDHNWAASASTQSGTGDYLPNPDGEPSVDQQKNRDNKTETSCFTEDRSRIFHDDIPIPGTDIALHYASNRVEGYKQVITVPASGGIVPDGVKSIVVDVEVAGRTFNMNFSPQPNRVATFVWDGLDYLGNPVTSAVVASVFVGYSYDSFYREAGDYDRAFAQPGTEITDIPAREDDIWWRRNGLLINMGKDTIAEGWTLSHHHQFSPLDPGTLLKGDGSIATTRKTPAIHSVAGDGTLGFGGDGSPATDAWLCFPSDVAVDAEGNIYIADLYSHRIRKVDTEGIITTVAGTGDAGFSGDDGRAVNAQLDRPVEIVVDAEGNLYIADFNNGRIRKVDTNGIITTVAGGGQSDFIRNDIPAIDARIGSPDSLALDVSGNLYIGDTSRCRIYKVYRDGREDTEFITHVAGRGGAFGSRQIYDFDEQDGGPATEATFFPSALAADASGNLYVGCLVSQRVLRINKCGIITSIAGNGRQGYDGDGDPATEARLFDPIGLALDVSGNLYVSDKWNYRIRRVDSSGIITTVAGNGTGGYMGDGGPAIAAGFVPMGIEFDAAGSLYLADYLNSRVRKLALTTSGEVSYTGDEDIVFPEENGLGHRMNASGRHVSTFDLATGTTLYDFGYALYNQGQENQDARLVSITDRFGDKTTVRRYGNGEPFSIVSPDGITTELTIDANNHLTGIVYPDGSFYEFEYTLDGLMTAKIEPEGNGFEHQFDENGRLTDATDQEGGHWEQSKTAYPDGNILAEVISGAGVTSYLDHTDSTGKYTSTLTDPAGGETLFTESADGLTVEKSLQCGTELDFEYDVEPRYRLKYVSKVRETTPSGLTKRTFRNKMYYPEDPDAPSELATETISVNGKATSVRDNVSQSLQTVTSPEGRTATIDYDPSTLLTARVSIPGLYDTDYEYDGRGRVTSITTNARETSFSYTSEGFLGSVTDSENHTTTYAHDAVGRVTHISRPDGTFIGLTYDQNGNMTVLTNPATIKHGFGYNRVNLNSFYQTPLSGSYMYVHDSDRRLVETIFPSGVQINNVYSTTRLMQIQTPEGDIDLTYACGTKVGTITNGTDTITYGYDGKLLTSEELSGTLNAAVSYAYNNDFNVSSFTYAGESCFYMYDDDGLLSRVGGYAISRNAQNGLPEAVILYGEEEPVLHLSRSFNGYGELKEQGYTISGNTVTSWELNRDNAGKITEKTETVEGVTSDYVYTYDSTGRLLTVTKDSSLVEEYDYDANGARIYEMNALRGILGRTFAYSDEDHLLTAGDTTYQYDVDGFLTSKTEGTDATTYDYSSLGELLSVSLPGGTLIEYLHDPLGRRIAKKVDGVVNEKYLWQGLTRLLAVYDGSDDLVMRFEYADGRMPVSMTKDGSTYYLAYDQVGSLKLVADEFGDVVRRIEYDSFGNIIDDSNPSFEIPFGFAGGLQDGDTGLLRLGYRDYDPDVGRWTAKDPILFAGADTDLYGYCLNNPTLLIDPWGLCSAKGVWGTIGMIGSGIGQALVEGAKGAAQALGESAPTWVTAGKVAVVSHTFAAVKGAATYAAVNAGLVVYTEVMATAGSPWGQHALESAADILDPSPPSTAIGVAERMSEEVYYYYVNSTSP
jgi:RHS repeat-associated protein